MKRYDHTFTRLLSAMLLTLAGCTHFDSATAILPGANRHPPRILLFIGQDLKSIQNYVDSGAFPPPGGVVGYSSIYEANGLTETVNYGSGEMNLSQTLIDHPQSIGMLGLYMVEGDQHPDGLTAIVDGLFDSQIDTLAEVINEAERPVLVRIGYEFDGVWNHYDPGKYVAAYRYIVTRLRAQSPYFLSVWHSAASPADRLMESYFDGKEGEDFRDWYPGDAYVNWVGVSWFISHLPMQRAMAQAVTDFAREHQKPVIIAESTPQGYDLVAKDWRNLGALHADAPRAFNASGGTLIAKVSDEAIWEQWFAPLLAYVQDNEDIVRALCYINTHWDADPMWGPDENGNYPNGYWGDSRLETTTTLKALWNAEIRKPRWVHGDTVDWNDWMPANIPALIQ